MASAGSSSNVGAPDGGRAATACPSGVPSAPVDETALDELVERALAAHTSGRSVFAASLWRRAAVTASDVHGNTLMAAVCKLKQATCLVEQAFALTSPDEAAALDVESWVLVSSVLPLLSTRMDDNTLLPGRCTKTEVEFNKRVVLVKYQIHDAAPPSARDLQLEGFGGGYGAVMIAARHVLGQFLDPPQAPNASEIMAFVLRAVDMMLPASRSLQGFILAEEFAFAHLCSEMLLHHSANPLFDALRDRWTAPAMLAMRSERELLDVAAKASIAAEEATAIRLADVAARGLKTSFFPPCGKVESTVLEFRSCSACRSAWYCSAEHGALHWKQHKPICSATVAAKHAAAAEDEAAAVDKE